MRLIKMEIRKISRKQYEIEFNLWYKVIHKNVENNCKHDKYLKWKNRKFDLINGFEITEIRCSNCNKLLELTIKALNKPKKPKRLEK